MPVVLNIDVSKLSLWSISITHLINFNAIVHVTHLNIIYTTSKFIYYIKKVMYTIL